ncbi:MAG: AAA family ATPase [Solobacterium sp.]|nr:AAA family ATPase [Solobacterium sp.]
MNRETAASIFRAVHEGKWLSIEYRNLRGELTRYWIAVLGIDTVNKRIRCRGFHIVRHLTAEMNLHPGGILSAFVIEGTIAPVNEELVNDIRLDPGKYADFFRFGANLRILDYYAACARLDVSPYTTDYALVRKLDDSVFENGRIRLSDEQFDAIVRDFQMKGSLETGRLRMQELGMNLLSIYDRKGIYVLAYRPLYLNVEEHTLAAGTQTVVCREFTVNGRRESIRRFLSEEDMVLTEDFARNAEIIKDLIMERNRAWMIDDMPYVIAIGRDMPVDLRKEYAGIMRMMENGEPTQVIRAFFGDLCDSTAMHKAVPLICTDDRINMDQMIAVNHALRRDLSYVQGPPGTGKTQTIVTTLISCLFANRTVLLASNNNHPINAAFAKLKSLTWKGQEILMPAARLGNRIETEKMLQEIGRMYRIARNMKDVKYPPRPKQENAAKLSRYLQEYEKLVEIREKKETLETLLESSDQMNFQIRLQTDQLPALNEKLAQMDSYTPENARKLLSTDPDELLHYLYMDGIRRMRRLAQPQYKELRDILGAQTEDRTAVFNRWLSVQENLELFLNVFPIVATTSVSAFRLGQPQPSFDLAIIDEASQCSTAMSLLPVIRGKRLMLVGDPQQLSPVILLSEEDNAVLRTKYGIREEYDYIKNSIYKTFLACDAVSDEVLLRFHYRCDPAIIGFNNHKYYCDRLLISSEAGEDPLVFIDVDRNPAYEKNTAPSEVQEVVECVRRYGQDDIGIITPFTAQRNMIRDVLNVNGFSRTECGTVHAFQGDEKDTVVFSLALSDRTAPATYDWLKNNSELINVAVSRAKKRLILIGSARQLERLHTGCTEDDLYDLYAYIRSRGTAAVASKKTSSRALGIRPYSTSVEEAFLTTLNHALENAFRSRRGFIVHREVPVAHVFADDPVRDDYFYRGRFDFVVYEKKGSVQLPVLAIELDGMEHIGDEHVRKRDRKKESICHEHGFELIRVENTYARRYHYIREILIRYFRGK